MIRRRLLGLFTVVLVTSGAASAWVVTFEDLALEPGSYWNGSDGSGGFTSGRAHFNNSYSSDWGSWDGFAYSNVKDTTSQGLPAQYNAIPGAGQAGSPNYALCYMGFGQVPTVTLEEPAVVEGFYATNVNYSYYSMLNGDAWAKKFGGDSGADADWFMLTVTGRDAAGGPTGTVDFYLADFRSADARQDYIVDSWQWVDLTGLGVVKTLELTLGSSDTGQWGMNTPAYFAMDNLTIVPEPGTLALLGLGGLVLTGRRRYG